MENIKLNEFYVGFYGSSKSKQILSNERINLKWQKVTGLEIDI